MPEATTDTVLAALAKIADPCSIATGAPVNLVEMGLIEEVALVGGEAHVLLRFTAPMCWQAAQIVDAIRRYVLEIDGIDNVEIEVDPNGDWMPDMMAPEARERLRALRPLELASTLPLAPTN